MRDRVPLPLLVILVAGVPAAVARGGTPEARVYEVRLEGRHIGEARLSVGAPGDGTRRLRLESAIASGRAGGAVRHLVEEVVSREGRFVSGRGRLQVGTTVTTFRAAAEGGDVVTHRDEAETRLPFGPEAPWAPLDATRDLALRGVPGDRRPVFDASTATLGEVVLVSRAPDGSVVTDELGVRVRTVWRGDDLLPVRLTLESVGLEYRDAAGAGARGPRATTGTGADDLRTVGGEGDDPIGRAVRVEGRLAPGARIRLEPAEAFPGLACPADGGRITASGPVCPAAPGGSVGAPPPVGPKVRALVAALPPGAAADPLASARWLAAEIARRLSGPPRGAAVWEATPEQALEAGAGDCNEAAAVFMAAAPHLDLEARRRTGLVLDPDDPALLWPHAWVEVRVDEVWVRVDPERGEAPARGLYVDLGDGDTLAARLRPVSAALAGARVVVSE